MLMVFIVFLGSGGGKVKLLQQWLWLRKYLLIGCFRWFERELGENKDDSFGDIFFSSGSNYRGRIRHDEQRKFYSKGNESFTIIAPFLWEPWFVSITFRNYKFIGRRKNKIINLVESFFSLLKMNLFLLKKNWRKFFKKKIPYIFTVSVRLTDVNILRGFIFVRSLEELYC